MNTLIEKTEDTIIVKTDKRKSQSATWPGVGYVTIDENGEFATQNAEGVAELIKHFPEFYNKAEGPVAVVDGAVNDNPKPTVEAAQDLSGEMTEEEIREQQLALEQIQKNAEEAKSIDTTEVKTDELQKTEINQLQEQKQEENNTATGASEEEKGVYLEHLNTLTRAALEAECKSFPGSEWRGKNKEALIEYLMGKLN